MRFGRSDLQDFTYFLAIARHRSFRLAAVELGLSRSALSHALKGLEARLGVRLVNRTNRSMTLTAAGADLVAAIGGPFEAIEQAVDDLNRYRGLPTGRIRLNVAGDAAMLVLAPVLTLFAERYPEVEVEVTVSNRMVDVTESGFDAGIRYGGTVPEDMIAQRLSPDLRWVVVASPAYLDAFGRPTHPSDLLHHRCINIRAGDDRIYRWEFERDEEAIELAVPGSNPTNRKSTMVATSDIGTEVANLLVGPVWSGQRVVELGSMVTADEVAEQLGEVLKVGVRAFAVPRAGWAEAFEQFGIPKGRTGPAEEMFEAVNAGWMDIGVEGTEHVAGTTSARDVFEAAQKAATT